MKVILSVEPIRFPLTGIGRYTLEIARHMAGSADVEALRYFSEGGFLEQLPSPSETPASPSVSAIIRAKRLLARNKMLLETYRFMRGRKQVKALAGTQDWLYHGPNYYLPETEGPSVVTFHDLSVITMPECHPVERVLFMKKEMELSLQRASFVITDSDHARHEIAKHYSWPLERIRTVYLAGSGNFVPRSAQETSAALADLDLPHGGYTLYAGTIEPRKNLERLLMAYEMLDPKLRQRYPLILAGFKGWNNDAILQRIDAAQRAGWARYLGYVPEGVLPHLFSAARLFVFPSLHEGFGLPVLEAMASAVPVVCSDTSSLPEVAGDAAAMCAPADVDGLSYLIAQGLQDEGWRSRATARGLAQAQKFSWQRCGAETVQLYRDALAAA
ncbi:glycosyltransferase family 1 protein [Mesorhizobium sp. CAU 1741]|uniref:glycosyltransferase family 4 protein n=1 Tax=Mesorhizobium sp. CAU 1741 TaxID=3140366 RepID=UPI00325C271A